MPQPATTGKEDGGNGMSSAMQSMNTVMPIMSAFFCLTLPVGVGIYWIMSAVIRAIQQFVINKRLDQESQEDIIKAAQEKMNKKRARQGLPPQKITNQAHTSTKSFEVEEKAARKKLRNWPNKKRRPWKNLQLTIIRMQGPVRWLQKQTW